VSGWRRADPQGYGQHARVAAAGAGSGLRGLADRIEALGGRLEMESAAVEVIALRARIPCPDGAR